MTELAGGGHGGSVRWRAPGRVNLVGEHTDYNGGLAMPFAIQQSCLAEVVLRDSGYQAVSAQEPAPFSGELSEVRTAEAWVRYVLGAAAILEARGVPVPPLEVRVDSDVPSGAGLSSSAAVICAVVGALDDLMRLGLTPAEQVALAVTVENDVVGAPTGGLDQLVSVNGRDDHAVLCDFADPDRPSVEHLPLDLDGAGLALLVLDTRVRHSHADGAYAHRRRSCEDAAARLGVRTLGELTPGDLADALARLENDELRRCVRHVVTEDERVRQVAALLREGRVADIGPALSASHASLRDDYAVSCAELDLAVDVMQTAGALGARLTGGGFGGCAIALVPEARSEEVGDAVRAAYAEAGLPEPRWFTARPSPGSRPAPAPVPPSG